MKNWRNCPQNRAKNKEMEDGGELIKTSLGGQRGHHRVPERENEENVEKELSQEIVQKNINFHIEKAHWVLNTMEEENNPDQGTSLTFQNLGAETILKTFIKPFKKKTVHIWRIKNQNGFRFLNSNNDSNKTMNQCFQNSEEKFT